MPAPVAVSILMPCYGLAGSIAANIARVVAAVSEIPGAEVVVADDGSTDGTREEAEAAAARHGSVRVVANPQNAGKARALQRAFAASTGEIVVFLDGDLDLPPEQVPGMIAALQEGGWDALLGAKRASLVAGGYPWARRVLSRAFSGAIRLAFRLPVAETQTGLKVFRRAPLEAALPRVQIARYSFDVELVLLLHRAGCRIAEYPVQLQAHAAGSRVTMGTLWEMGRDTARLWVRTFVRRPR